MGIIRAAATSAESMMEDSWKEIYYCDAIAHDTILVRGKKRTNPNSANYGTPENVISNGSKIIVNEGQAAVVVEDGKVIAVYDEPGAHIFTGGYGKKDLLHEFGKRVAFGGDNVSTQHRLYYISKLEMTGMTFVVCAPVTTGSGGAQMTVFEEIRGSYSIRILDGAKFYRTLSGNVRTSYSYSMLRSTMESEMRETLLRLLAELSKNGVDITQIGAHTAQFRAAVDEALAQGWAGDHGIGIASLAITSIAPQRQDTGRIQNREDVEWIRPDAPSAVRSAPVTPEEPTPAPVRTAVPVPPPAPEKAAGARWHCPCGCETDSKFCPDCGKPRPALWNCPCGAQGRGSFCENCGRPKPAQWQCSCGAAGFGKFCENCGKPKPEEEVQDV